MVTIATTRMSSKGQVVIPEEIWQKLDLYPGIQFAVLGVRGMIILRPLTPPSLDEFDKSLTNHDEG